MTAHEIDMPATAGTRPVPDPALILDSLGHAVIGTDLDGLIDFWNPAAERLYGWTARQALGRDLTTLTAPRTTERLRSEILESLLNRGTWSGALTAQRRDGSTFTALVTDSTLDDGAGNLVGLVGVSTDLDRAVRPLLARSAEATLVLTPSARISFLSPAAPGLLGRTAWEALDASLWDLVHPEDLAEATDRHRRMTDDPSLPRTFECRPTTDAGTDRWIEITMVDMFGDPAERGLVCTLRDVTTRREEHDQLVRTTGQLRTALTTRIAIERATGHIAGRTGADLRTAFQTLRGYARGHNRRLREVAAEVLAGELWLVPEAPAVRRAGHGSGRTAR